MSAFEFIASEKASADFVSVSAMCRVLGVSRSGFYAWSSRKPSVQSKRRALLASQVRRVHADSAQRYGSEKVARILRRRGEVVATKTVANLMRQNGLAARPKRRFRATTDSRNSRRIAPNLLERDFKTSAPNQVWVTDVTAYWTFTGWLYLAAVVDLFSRRVVSWAASERNDTTLALTALRKAVLARQPARGLIHHSDRGSPYASDDYIAEVEKWGIVRSMSKKGDCWDNAVAESFFSTLEFECVRGVVFETRESLAKELGGYIDNFYNPQRLHATLNYVSPIEAEVAFNLASQAA